MPFLEKEAGITTSPGPFPPAMRPEIIFHIEHRQLDKVHDSIGRLLRLIETTGPATLTARKYRCCGILGCIYEGARRTGLNDKELLPRHWQRLDELTRLRSWEKVERMLHQHVDDVLAKLPADRPRNLVQFVVEMRQQMQRNLADPWTLEHYAVRAGVTRVHLSRIFKQVVRRSFRDELNILRREEASRLLTDPGLTTKDVARRIGIRSPSRFIRWFSDQTGHTPGAYRRMHANHLESTKNIEIAPSIGET